LGIIATMHPAIFLDRDGVIMENRASYVRDWGDVEIYPQALQSLAEASASPFKFVIITNQSAVGRGIMSLEIARDINDRLVERIAKSGGRIDGVFMCPHAPQDHCNCRKPEPGLLIQAAEELSIDMSKSYIIGDAISDLLAGQAAGVKQSILVLTGRGKSQSLSAKPDNLKPYLVHNSLSDALNYLI
jgi:D-glycero-D-manno-heptose 1,7-bisphosphate phosphatase